MTDEISQLHHLRLKIAADAKALAERELSGRLLRLDLEARLRAGNVGISATQAEKLARAHPEYLAHEQETIQRTYDKAVAEAQAESLVWRLRFETAATDRVGVA